MEAEGPPPIQRNPPGLAGLCCEQAGWPAAYGLRLWAGQRGSFPRNGVGCPFSWIPLIPGWIDWGKEAKRNSIRSLMNPHCWNPLQSQGRPGGSIKNRLFRMPLF